MKFRNLLFPGLMAVIVFSINSARAGYLTPPVPVPMPVMYAEPAPCLQQCSQRCYQPCMTKKIRHHKKYRKPAIKKHYVKKPRRHVRARRVCGYREGIPVCVYQYYPQPEPVSFMMGSGYGREVNLIDCLPYDPDMSTGDDDPTIYPGMNINN